MCSVDRLYRLVVPRDSSDNRKMHFRTKQRDAWKLYVLLDAVGTHPYKSEIHATEKCGRTFRGVVSLFVCPSQ